MELVERETHLLRFANMLKWKRRAWLAGAGLSLFGLLVSAGLPSLLFALLCGALSLVGTAVCIAQAKDVGAEIGELPDDDESMTRLAIARFSVPQQATFEAWHEGQPLLKLGQGPR